MQTKVIGQLVCKEGKYWLHAAGKTEALPVGLLTDKKVLDQFVGKDVEVLYSVPTSFVVAVTPMQSSHPVIKGPIGLCNIPRPDFRMHEGFVTLPSEAAARNLVAYLINEKVIAPEIGDVIINSYAAAQQAGR